MSGGGARAVPVPGRPEEDTDEVRATDETGADARARPGTRVPGRPDEVRATDGACRIRRRHAVPGTDSRGGDEKGLEHRRLTTPPRAPMRGAGRGRARRSGAPPSRAGYRTTGPGAPGDRRGGGNRVPGAPAGRGGGAEADRRFGSVPGSTRGSGRAGRRRGRYFVHTHRRARRARPHGGTAALRAQRAPAPRTRRPTGNHRPVPGRQQSPPPQTLARYRSPPAQTSPGSGHVPARASRPGPGAPGGARRVSGGRGPPYAAARSAGRLSVRRELVSWG